MTTQRSDQGLPADAGLNTPPDNSGLPTEGGADQSGLAGEVGTQPGGGNPSVTKEQTNREDENQNNRDND